MKTNQKKNNFVSVDLRLEMIGLRIDKALGMVPEIGSRSRAVWLIDKNLVQINSKSPKSSHILKPEDKIEISFPDPQATDLVPLNTPLNILFEDDDVIVLNKPAGLVIHPAAGHAQDTLVNALISHTKDLSMRFGEQRPGIVHRLDKETSGILVVAKNDFSHENLSLQFKNRTVHRVYFAATLGTSPLNTGKIQSFLARHPTDRKRYASVLGHDRKIIRDLNAPVNIGKWAVTNFTQLKKTSSGFSYFQLKLETGRTHQIRVHLSEMGCPIIGDITYGASRKLKTIQSGKARELASQFPRFSLHAAELGFIHPKSGQNLKFNVDWPQDLKPLLIELNLLEPS